MITGRNLRFQLTALVDLLLIIVFAQFAELRQRQFESQAAQKTELANIRRNHEQELRAAEVAAQASVQDATQRADEYQQQLSQTIQSMQSAFGELSSTAPSTSIKGIDLAQRFEQLATDQPDEVARFFIGYDELLKRAEVWILHARDSGEIVVKIDHELKRFRLESGSQDQRATEFAERFFAAAKQIRQPKGLVIILASYDIRATAGVYQGIIDGLPRAADRLRADAPQTRFEFSVLGPTRDPLASESTQQ
jgi:hypothetical protein